jgi:hypothetical protein
VNLGVVAVFSLLVVADAESAAGWIERAMVSVAVVGVTPGAPGAAGG